MNIHPNLLSFIHEGALLVVGVDANDQNLLQTGALLKYVYQALVRRRLARGK
jgi:hypothetical protein